MHSSLSYLSIHRKAQNVHMHTQNMYNYVYIYMCVSICVYICVCTHTHTGSQREILLLTFQGRRNRYTFLPYIIDAVAIQHSLKYMQIKFYKESNQIEAALFSSIAIYKRTDSGDSYSICSPLQEKYTNILLFFREKYPIQDEDSLNSQANESKA